jgi:hypothetical protein
MAINTRRPSRLSEPMHTGLLNGQRRASIVERDVETVKLDSGLPGKGFEGTGWMPQRSHLIGVGDMGYSTECEDSGFGL